MPEPAAHVDPAMNGHAAAPVFNDRGIRDGGWEPDAKPSIRLPQERQQHLDTARELAASCARPAGGGGNESGSQHESQLVQLQFDFMLTNETPERVIGDRAFDGDALDAQLAEQGNDLIAPHRRNRRPENVMQDACPLHRYTRRWTVERTIARFQNFRRLCIRWEKSTMLFRGDSHFACAFMLLREVQG